MMPRRHAGRRWRTRKLLARVAPCLALLAPGLAPGALVGCGTTESTGELVQEARVSGCGGLARTAATRSHHVSDYCDAEVLRWRYDEKRRELRLSDERVMLRCCGGERSVHLVAMEDAYVLREIDRPAVGTGRCRCQCPYDFLVVASPAAKRVVAFSILREEVGAGDGRMVFQGRLNLREGQGVEIIDTRSGDDCRRQALLGS